MTKNTKNLTWKLSELPTASELADLVNSGVITKEEAREIMFGSAESDKEVIKTLQDQIEFLQDLVKELSKRSTTTYIPTITREVHITRPYWDRYWMSTNKVLSDAGYTLSTTGLSTTVNNTAGTTLTGGTAGTTFYSNSSGDPEIMSVSLSQKNNTIS